MLPVYIRLKGHVGRTHASQCLAADDPSLANVLSSFDPVIAIKYFFPQIAAFLRRICFLFLAF